MCTIYDYNTGLPVYFINEPVAIDFDIASDITDGITNIISSLDLLSNSLIVMCVSLVACIGLCAGLLITLHFKHR